MAGNYYQDLNSNPFNTGVQLHHTPPHNAGLADGQQPSIFTTQAQARCAGSDNPLRLGGYLPAPAMTFPGERSQRPSSVQFHRTPQASTRPTFSTATQNAGAARRGLVIMVPIISKQRNRGLITVLCYDMTKSRKSKWGDLSPRVFSRDPMIRIFYFRPPSVSRALPRWHVGSGFKHFGWFRRFNGSGEQNLAKVSGPICPPGCPLEIQ
jgi:hypothetical protein